MKCCVINLHHVVLLLILRDYRLTEPLAKRKKMKYSDVKVQTEQENVLENEMTELDSLFIIERNEHPLMDSGSFLLKCSIGKSK